MSEDNVVTNAEPPRLDKMLQGWGEMMQRGSVDLDDHQYLAPRLLEAALQLAEQRAEIERLESELDEARYEPWPKWADEIRKKLEGYGVDTGPENEWDIGHDFEEWLNGTIQEETRDLTAQLAAANLKLASAREVIELQRESLDECYLKARDHLRVLYGDEKPFGEYRRYMAATEAARAWREKESWDA